MKYQVLKFRVVGVYNNDYLVLQLRVVGVYNNELSGTEIKSGRNI